MMSEEYRKRLAIDKILSSPHVGFFRLCGRELQIKYRKANMAHNNPDREALLAEIIAVYKKAIDDKKPPMDEKEKKHKIKLVEHLATKTYERK